ncbi:MAG TPA: hypothetical protein PLT09_00905 [Deltaproteobacteria bacterium]|nr:hypothetical protein [Deltaproteobacteria bacterium]HPR53832.1 hypothetical protein [Deltaproteobacteria bacterium]HXK45968.1 hypothetical protein [Deltaproteobacteria bacterium]
MRIDVKLAVLFIFPIMACIFCFASAFLLPNTARYSPAHPEFLSTIDQLSLFTMEGSEDVPAGGIRDVFRHEWTLSSSNLTPYPDTQALPISQPPRVTMIMEGGLGSFCIINGKKMYLGDRTDTFRVTALGKDSVTITYQNGTRETHHVKAY